MEKLVNGSTLGAFRILNPIGEGGMAKVYKAFQPSMERYVALKVLPSHFAEDPQFVERFIREARTIAQLEHRNILPVYEFGEERGVTYLAMRYVEGGTLKELLAKGRLTLHDTLDLMVQICAALDYAHRRGVVHRDVKPSNVILDSEGAAYLMDFGIAKVVGISGDLTATGQAIGTPAYMAPEQAMGNPVDGRTDIYALGIILYEMVVGRVPFQADTPIAVLMAHLRDPLPMPREKDPSVPEAIEAVIIKALSKEPGDRYQTANDLAAALRKAVHSSADRVEASTLVTLIQEVQGSRPAPAPAPERSTDPRIQRQVEQDYIDGLSAYWIRDWQTALQRFQAVTSVNPDYKDAAARLGDVKKQLHLIDLYAQAQDAIQKRDWLMAQKLLQQVTGLEETYQQAASQLKMVNRQLEFSALYAQAEQLSEAKQWQAVIRVFDRLRELDPNYPDPQNVLVKAKAALAEQERMGRVKKTYERGLQALDSGKWKDAQRLFEQVRNEAPGYGATDQLLKRAADEQEKTRQAARPRFLRGKQTEPPPPPITTPRTSPQTPSAEAQIARKTLAEEAEPVDVDSAAKTIASPIAGQVATPDAATQLIPAKVSRPRRVPLWAWIAGLLALVAIFAGLFAAFSDELIGLVLPTGTTAPASGSKAQTPPRPQTSVELGFPSSHKHAPSEQVYDDFEAPELKIDQWALEGQCDAFNTLDHFIQDGVLNLFAYSNPKVQRCQFWLGRGERVPGGAIWPFEARMQFAGIPATGASHLFLAYVADWDKNHLQAVCGLKANENGKLSTIFAVWDEINGQHKEHIFIEEQAQYNRWLTFRLGIDPDNQAFECVVEDQRFGSYQYPDQGLVRELPFAAFIETERQPDVLARTQVDDVYLWPRPESAQPEMPPAKCPVISNWKAEYWNNPNLEGPTALCQDVEFLDLYWWNGSPAEGILEDGFSASFSRSVELEAGAYHFRLGADDGMRLKVDGKQVIDEWYEHGYFEANADMELAAGTHELVVQYFDLNERAMISFDWEKLEPTPGCLPPPEGVIGWWDGDGDENRVPGSAAKRISDAYFGMGMVGPSFIFNAREWKTYRAGNVITEIPEEFAALNTISIETWVFLDVVPHPTIERFVTITDEKFVLRKENDGLLHFYINVGGELHHLYGPSLPRGVWFHVAGIYDGRTMRLFYNGVQIAVTDIQGEMPHTYELQLSSDLEGLQGRLDEVTIYNRALNPEEIQLIYQAGQRGKCKP